ncbi:MAG TPA: hypothetical protein ACFYD3_05135 [Candidatus Hypogeohydataceae bacterium YC41]
MEEEKPGSSRQFKLGLVLIIGSLLCGYAALAVMGGAAGTHNTRLRNLSLLVYILSWIPFLIGFALSGKEGYKYAKKVISKRLFGSKDD